MSSSRAVTDSAVARTLAIRFSKSRVRSRQELEARLKLAQVSSRVASKIVNECQAAGLVDDEACAQLWAGHWARRGFAWGVIRQRLADKGLAASAIEQAGAAIGVGSHADEARAREMAAGCHADAKGMQRLARRLSARGFEAEVIEKVLSGAP